MVLVLGASTMLFVGIVAEFVVLRGASEQWPPPGSPPLPQGFLFSTAVLLLSSLTLAVAHLCIRRDRTQAFVRFLSLTSLLGVVFLGSQILCWTQLMREGFLPRTNVYGGNLYLITWTHAAHVVAALVILLTVNARALRGAYSLRSHLGVEIASMFWHFLDAVWVCMYLLLLS